MSKPTPRNLPEKLDAGSRRHGLPRIEPPRPGRCFSALAKRCSDALCASSLVDV
jgi:hypothetical protein